MVARADIIAMKPRFARYAKRINFAGQRVHRVVARRLIAITSMPLRNALGAARIRTVMAEHAILIRKHAMQAPVVMVEVAAAVAAPGTEAAVAAPETAIRQETRVAAVVSYRAAQIWGFQR